MKRSMRRKEINSTKLRMAIRTRLGAKLSAFLYRNALSPAILWWYLPKWLDKTRNGSSGISFLSSPSLGQEPQPVVVPTSRKRALSVAFPEDIHCSTRFGSILGSCWRTWASISSWTNIQTNDGCLFGCSAFCPLEEAGYTGEPINVHDDKRDIGCTCHHHAHVLQQVDCAHSAWD